MIRGTVVIGLGNVLLGDEGIGIHLVSRLRDQANRFGDVDFFDLGTGGLKVVHALAGRRKAVFVDCALMNKPPGTLRRFAPGQAVSRKQPTVFSCHAADLLALLDVSRQLGECPGEIVIFGIQPQQLQPGHGLSPVLVQRIEYYLEQIGRELPGRKPEKGEKSHEQTGNQSI